MYFFGNGQSATVAYVKSNHGSVEDYIIDMGRDTNYWIGYNVVSEGYNKWVETSPAKPAWRELTHYVCHADGATKNP